MSDSRVVVDGPVSIARLNDAACVQGGAGPNTLSVYGAHRQGSVKDCVYCSHPGADVCVQVLEKTSGPGCPLYAHCRCATARGVQALDEEPTAPESGR